MIGLLFSAIPGKVKIYALIAGVIFLAFVGVRWDAGQDMARKIEAKNNKRRLEALRDKQKIIDEVKHATDDVLVSGILRKR